MRQLQAVWLGVGVSSALVLLTAAAPYGLGGRLWISFPLLLTPPVVVLGWWMQKRRADLRGWPSVIGLLVGFTLTSSVLVALLDSADDVSDVRGANYWMFAPWIAPFACAPAIIAFYLARWSVRLRKRP